MSEIYLARHQDATGKERDVVIKRLLPELGSDPEFMKMFLDEAQIVLRLRHPNVVHVIRPLFFKNESLLVMEFVRGASMSALLRHARKHGAPIPYDVTASIGAQIAAGLHHAHEMRDRDGNPMEVVHRDVSPGNILVSYEGVAKILDFGVARALGRLSHTGSRVAKGTPSYMAPEQLNHARLDRRTDIFGLGVVLWEAATNRKLFPAAKGDAAGCTALSDPIIPAGSLSEVPAELAAVITQALEREPEARFQTAEEMSVALGAFADAAGASVGRVAEYVRGLNAVSGEQESGSTPATLALKKQRQPRGAAQAAPAAAAGTVPARAQPTVPAAAAAGAATGATSAKTSAGAPSAPLSASPSPALSPSPPAEPGAPAAGSEPWRLGRLSFWALTVVACLAGAGLTMGIVHNRLREVLWPESSLETDHPESAAGGSEASSGSSALTGGPDSQSQEAGSAGGGGASGTRGESATDTTGGAPAGTPVIAPIRPGDPAARDPADDGVRPGSGASGSDTRQVLQKHHRGVIRQRSRKRSASAEHKSSSSIWDQRAALASWAQP